MSATGFFVGQQVWVVWDRRRGEPGYYDITKVGHRWVTLEGHAGRFDAETLQLDGGGYSSPGRIYLYKDEWESEQEAHKAWREFYCRLNGYNFKPPSAEAVRKAAEILGVPLPSTEGK